MDNITILIADDSAPFRDGMRAMLRRETDMVIVGEAASGAEAVRLAAAQQPDVVLMDLQMPEGNGIDATRTIVTASPHMRILVLTMFEDDDSVFAALQAGARGYILKGADKREVLRAIRAVHNGEAIFGPVIAQRLVHYFAARHQSSSAQPPFPELSEREREILAMIARGKSNQEIADDLVVSLKTVRNHVSNIFAKLQVADRAQAMDLARRAGLGRTAAG
ncbi:response regulator [Candidatus Amarolinea aalborgensis]|jgi:DNA-binding NarL/FixJ family response regulator|uniref:response regulator n=1 Tax=Candidatus Amarolinea aalborgensis TaxID=2249329 RepID=UPI003BF97570